VSKKQKPNYWAYGSNLNVAAMKVRCPGAVKDRRLILPQAALVFRGVADVEYHDTDVVHGGLWRITRENERTLDAYEGVRGGLYEKRYMILRDKGEEETYRVLFYQMTPNHNGVMPPSDGYVRVIAQGYHDFGLPLDALDKALARSWNDKQPDDWLRERHKKRGGGRLARKIK
jgi:gamma-glutamylcyclotransferase